MQHLLNIYQHVRTKCYVSLLTKIVFLKNSILAIFYKAAEVYLVAYIIKKGIIHNLFTHTFVLQISTSKQRVWINSCFLRYVPNRSFYLFRCFHSNTSEYCFKAYSIFIIIAYFDSFNKFFSLLAK